MYKHNSSVSVFKRCNALKSHAAACSWLFLVCLFDSQGWNSFSPCILSPIRIVLTALISLFQGQDEHILESPTCIRFLIKLLKPIISTATEDKTRNIGSKLLALRKDSDILRDTSKLADSSSTAIAAKVQEILVNCKDMKSHSGDDSRTERPELTPKWIALLSIEKACLSKISFEGMLDIISSNFVDNEVLVFHFCCILSICSPPFISFLMVYFYQRMNSGFVNQNYE